MANRNWANAGRLFAMHVKPVLLDCNFIVDSTNGNGLGIRSLKGPCIKNVYMHTSATPAPGNPNPAAGLILVELSDNYNRYFCGFDGQGSPLSGTPLTAVVAGNAYVIVSLGTATLAQWQAVGFPPGFVPALGAAFIATSSATIGGGAAVEASSVSGINKIELIGDPNQTIANSAQAQNGGANIVLQCLAPTSSSVTTPIATAPANGTVMNLSFYMSDSSILIQGE